MNFIRQNLFFVGLIGVVIACVGGLVVIGAGPRSSIEEELEKRQTIENGLNRLRPSLGKVNENIVTERKKWVEDIKQKIEQVRSDAVRWNQRNYKVLQLQRTDGSLVGAFPVDEELYETELLTNSFTRQYIESYRSLVDSLHPTGAAVQQTDIDREVQAVGAELARSGKPVGSGTQQLAQRQGRSRALLKKARAGWIYVTDEGFDRVFTEPRSIATFRDLWDAQVNLWVTRDIIAAIRTTNEQAMKDLPESQKNVLRAPVKRLVRISIDESYFAVAGSEEPRGTSGRPRPTGRPLGPLGGDRPSFLDDNDDYYHGTTEREVDTTGSLTERASCREYDVVRYYFTVVVPSGALQDLLVNLLGQNYHTIHKTDITSMDVQEGSFVYYYGPDPVLKVTVHGEVLFLTDWSRGTWDATEKKWSGQYPPLIPVEALENLRTRSSEALRPEDKRRLPEPVL